LEDEIKKTNTIPPYTRTTTTTTPIPTEQSRIVAGNFLFFINCLCTSLYVLLSKRPLQKHSSILVTAWSYNLAAVFMAVTAVVTSWSPRIMEFACPDCNNNNGGGDIWKIPSGARGALMYNILFNSVAAYGIITWANQYATGTLVMAYTVLQPVTASVLSFLLVSMFGVYPRCHEEQEQMEVMPCLDPPGWGTLVGIAGVFTGLFVVIGTEKKDRFEKRSVSH